MGIEKIAYIFVGGGIGSVLRYTAVSGMQRHAPDYPWGTVCVNVTGSFLIGIAWALCNTFDLSPNSRTFIFVGLLGGFTTFSSFSLDTMNLLNAGKITGALSYAVGTTLSGILAVFLGFFLTKYMLSLFKLA